MGFSNPQLELLRLSRPKRLLKIFNDANSNHDECCCCEAADGLSEGGSEEDEIPENMAEMPGDRGCEPLHHEECFQSKTTYEPSCSILIRILRYNDRRGKQPR